MSRDAAGFEIRALLPGEVAALYADRLTRDFPPDELKPLSAIRQVLEKGRYACFAATRGEVILAYAFFVKMDRRALVDYFAVKEELRGAGIGSRFLRELVAGPLRGMACALLEVEDPDRARDGAERAARERRLAFYLRNGLRQTGVSAVVWHVPYRVLELPLGAPKPADEIRRVYAALYRGMMPKKIFDAMVEL